MLLVTLFYTVCLTSHLNLRLPAKVDPSLVGLEMLPAKHQSVYMWLNIESKLLG